MEHGGQDHRHHKENDLTDGSPDTWAEVSVPPKLRTTIRIDADVLEFFRSEGSGYQTRINAVLRAYMEYQRAKERM